MQFDQQLSKDSCCHKKECWCLQMSHIDLNRVGKLCKLSDFLRELSLGRLDDQEGINCYLEQWKWTLCSLFVLFYLKQVLERIWQFQGFFTIHYELSNLQLQ